MDKEEIQKQSEETTKVDETKEAVKAPEVNNGASENSDASTKEDVNDVEFTDLEVCSLGFNLDELRLLIDTFQKEMDSRVTMEVMEKLI